MHWVHFFPFSPAGEHGGTLRLQTAELACGRLGEQQTFWFDRSSKSWRDDSGEPSHASPARRSGLKRRIFPSTLYESGGVAVEAFRKTNWSAKVPSSANAMFHTTYLGPLLMEERPPWLNKAVIDVYDLIWRAHSIDARLNKGPLHATRLAYSQSVKHREMKAIAHSDGAAVAGYEDWCHVRNLGTTSAWCPVGVIPRPGPVRVPHDPPQVGFLGNFAHQPTVDSARYLLTCPAARAGDIKVVLAGWESAGFAEEFSGRAEILGPVRDPGELWHTVDCAVIPVQTGAGMKVKVSEALLAGCPVITTPLGADGFSPAIRQALHIVDHVSDVTRDMCMSAGASSPLNDGTLDDLSMEGASALYGRLLEDILDR
jgi:Glycosyl transferases group 1